MQISIDLSSEQSQRLQDAAFSLGVQPKELAKAALDDLLSQPRDDFRRAAQYVLEKNRTLYERLS